MIINKMLDEAIKQYIKESRRNMYIFGFGMFILGFSIASLMYK